MAHSSHPGCGTCCPPAAALAPLLPVLSPSPPSTVQRLMAGHMCGRSCGELSTPCLAVGADGQSPVTTTKEGNWDWLLQHGALRPHQPFTCPVCPWALGQMGLPGRVLPGPNVSSTRVALVTGPGHWGHSVSLKPFTEGKWFHLSFKYHTKYTQLSKAAMGS